MALQPFAYVADPGAGKVYKVDLTTFTAVDSVSGLSSPTDIVLDAGNTNRILVSDPVGHKIGRFFFNIPGWFNISTAGHADPYRLTSDPSNAGFLWYTSTDASLHGWNGSSFYDWALVGTDVPQVMYIPGGLTQLFVDCLQGGAGTTHTTYVFNTSTGIPSFAPTLYTSFANPGGAGDILLDGTLTSGSSAYLQYKSHLVVWNTSTHSVTSTTSVFSDNAVAATNRAGQFVRLGSDGHIRIYNTSGTLLANITPSAQGISPTGFTAGATNQLWMSDEQANPGLQMIDVNAQTVTTHAGIITGGSTSFSLLYNVENVTVASTVAIQGLDAGFEFSRSDLQTI